MLRWTIFDIRNWLIGRYRFVCFAQYSLRHMTEAYLSTCIGIDITVLEEVLEFSDRIDDLAQDSLKALLKVLTRYKRIYYIFKIGAKSNTSRLWLLKICSRQLTIAFAFHAFFPTHHLDAFLFWQLPSVHSKNTCPLTSSGLFQHAYFEIVLHTRFLSSLSICTFAISFFCAELRLCEPHLNEKFGAGILSYWFQSRRRHLQQSVSRNNFQVNITKISESSGKGVRLFCWFKNT